MFELREISPGDPRRWGKGPREAPEGGAAARGGGGSAPGSPPATWPARARTDLRDIPGAVLCCEIVCARRAQPPSVSLHSQVATPIARVESRLASRPTAAHATAPVNALVRRAVSHDQAPVAACKRCRLFQRPRTWCAISKKSATSLSRATQAVRASRLAQWAATAMFQRQQQRQKQEIIIIIIIITHRARLCSRWPPGATVDMCVCVCVARTRRGKI